VVAETQNLGKIYMIGLIYEEIFPVYIFCSIGGSSYLFCIYGTLFGAYPITSEFEIHYFFISTATNPYRASRDVLVLED
jgi:hypothetical protein